jgi:hypothetical protein
MLGTAMLPEKYETFLMQNSHTLQVMVAHFSEGAH